jgi:glyoxylate carboligase
LITKSLWNLRQESRAALHLSAFMSIVGIYVMYLVFVWHGLNKSFVWTISHLSSKGLSGLAAALAEYAYQDLIINVGIVAALTWAFNVKLTDPENITRVDEHVDEPAAPS